MVRGTGLVLFTRTGLCARRDTTKMRAIQLHHDTPGLAGHQPEGKTLEMVTMETMVDGASLNLCLDYVDGVTSAIAYKNFPQPPAGGSCQWASGNHGRQCQWTFIVDSRSPRTRCTQHGG